MTINRLLAAYRAAEWRQPAAAGAAGRSAAHVLAQRRSRSTKRCAPLRAASGDAAAAALPAAGADQPDATLFVRRPLAPGQALRNDGGSIVIVGGVPRGASVTAAGDVVILGALEGSAAAAAPGAMVVALGLGPDAAITIAGVPAGAAALRAAPPGRRLMAVLEGPAAAAAAAPADGGSGSPAGTIVLKPLPGVEGLPPAAAAGAGEEEAAGKGILSQLVPAAALALGVALTAAPSAVLGSLVGGGAEGVVGALLETLVYGEWLL